MLDELLIYDSLHFEV